MNKIVKVLNELKPYVIVVGSFARGEQTSSSDVDLYIKRRTQDELDNDWYNELEEHYIDKVIEVFDNNSVSWDSLFVSYIHTTNLAVQIEASSLFKIGKNEEIKIVNIFGVDMFSAVDNKNLNYDDLLDI